MVHANKGIGHLAKFILRRDRVRIPLWVLGIAFFTIIVPPALEELYGTEVQRAVMAETMKNPAMIAMMGPANFENYTVGVMTAHEMVLLTAVVVGIMSILLVTRHTRGDEEDGRIEMIRSLPVGRLANLNATLLVYTVVYIVLAIIVGIGLYALNIESMDLEGSLLYGAVLGGTGIFFAGVTAVFGQLSESSHGAIGFSIAILLLAYIVRAIGDVSNEVLSWLSPLGWITKTAIYDTNNWWPIMLIVGATLVLYIFANYLNARRDLEAGLFPAKPGRKNASAFLKSPLGLAFRLQKTGTIAWAVGMFVLGISYGSVFGDLDAFFEGNDMMEQMLPAIEGYSLSEQFMTMIMMVMAIIATIPPVMAMNKLYGEEKKGRIDHILARVVSRPRLMGSYLLISTINGFVMVSLSSLGLWLASNSVMEEPIPFSTLYKMGVIYYPAMLVMISIAVLLIGIIPKLTNIIWLYLFYSFIVLYMEGIFQFPDWVGKLSPFGHIPKIPLEEMSWSILFCLLMIAVVFTFIGFLGYRKRDIR